MWIWISLNVLFCDEIWLLNFMSSCVLSGFISISLHAEFHFHDSKVFNGGLSSILFQMVNHIFCRGVVLGIFHSWQTIVVCQTFVDYVGCVSLSNHDHTNLCLCINQIRICVRHFPSMTDIRHFFLLTSYTSCLSVSNVQINSVQTFLYSDVIMHYPFIAGIFFIGVSLDII